MPACTPSRCLSCTTRRNERTPRSHNLRLSWLLLCRLCMIFHQVGEFRKHGLRKPAKWRTGAIDNDVTPEPLPWRARNKVPPSNFPDFYARSCGLASVASDSAMASREKSQTQNDVPTNETTSWTREKVYLKRKHCGETNEMCDVTRGNISVWAGFGKIFR